MRNFHLNNVHIYIYVVENSIRVSEKYSLKWDGQSCELTAFCMVYRTVNDINLLSY